MTADEFRQRHRDYGVFIPLDDVPAHLANGWRVIDAGEELNIGRDEVLLKPPRKDGRP